MSEKKLSADQRLDLLEAKVQIILEGKNSVLTEVAKLDTMAKEHEDIIDLDKIAWTEKVGPKGPFQQTEDVNNIEYKKLAKFLADHEGKARFQGFFLWKFENGVTIGRKKTN
jgi:hypothetical protein